TNVNNRVQQMMSSYGMGTGMGGMAFDPNHMPTVTLIDAASRQPMRPSTSQVAHTEAKGGSGPSAGMTAAHTAHQRRLPGSEFRIFRRSVWHDGRTGSGHGNWHDRRLRRTPWTTEGHQGVGSPRSQFFAPRGNALSPIRSFLCQPSGNRPGWL